ncbi:hypothetical protein A2631_01520 [Candidatus Daviesbacteria bacterium RIFCSPHIGHO2_01_FULL_44_29]|uniref:DUF2127 domain-containing protein n=1 Tax=Candidatus Daviesbacteria bacterium RIFCSPHIGHO2_02_FULL_43_12 TaxID=1797776 RepID=A0A1F5KJI1_9BACT|nr:MAG: hypothetical protein A2631_01520 [Candidatus Daviesbacteria bacterium RIFCSPHIGHO2_01_FULL_44_29]OGE39069.1 MAG: hypothetical protein A3E86_00560 [Candidatus Daviesbacteria bacterium RIFCSPHIGHO2_12_FULL_47_45]OGE41086.1 MAG: hypothetical protein A3D25_00915 [Candidatus Daviesbacteria bacterium RIFCSPHIGHO2_02_FULL_43_12]OGE69285.1 MAG: hypothetical protein A3B55_02655 [Candidatus Daviesbacteria bacterium RIFCSPLOWO2_01_FULL_43_15]
MWRKLYELTIGRYTEVVSFIVLLSFLITFIIARLTIYLIDAQILPDFYLAVGQTHVHHLNYGIFLLSFVGYLALIYHDEAVNEILGILYGIGLGLTFDEFALWLHLQNDYYARVSYDAIVVIIVLLLNIIYLGNIWKRLYKYLTKQFPD